MKFQKLTPNLVVRDVAASMEFYRSVLGFQPAIKVPDEPPYVFGSAPAAASRFSSMTEKRSPKTTLHSEPGPLAARLRCSWK